MKFAKSLTENSINQITTNKSEHKKNNDYTLMYQKSCKNVFIKCPSFQVPLRNFQCRKQRNIGHSMFYLKCV